MTYNNMNAHMVILEEWTRSVRNVNNAKMTFRFNEQERIIPLQEKNIGFNNRDEWVTEPSSMDQGRVRQEERVPNYQTVDQTEEWGDPFADYTSTGGIVLPSYSKNPPRRTSWWKVAGSVTGAIVTGGLFGIVVLAMFNQQLSLPVPGTNVPSAQSSLTQQSDVPVMGSIEEEFMAIMDEEMLVNVALPQQTYYFLQYGVFSSAGGVELAQQELKESGIAAARDTVDEKRVYAGLSLDREQAKLLSSQLKTTGVHLILHEVILPSSAEVRFNGDVTALEHYLAQSAELVELLSSISASRLSELSPAALSDDQVKTLGEKHQLWTESAAAVRGKLPDRFVEGNAVLETAMNSAVEAVNEYQKKNAKTLLWEVQNEVMRFVLEEYKMMAQETS